MSTPGRSRVHVDPDGAELVLSRNVLDVQIELPRLAKRSQIRPQRGGAAGRFARERVRLPGGGLTNGFSRSAHQAIGLGLLCFVLWEGFFSGFVSGVRLLSIRHYAISLMHGLDPRRFAESDNLNMVAAIVLCALVFGGFLLLSVRRLRRMDVP